MSHLLHHIRRKIAVDASIRPAADNKKPALPSQSRLRHANGPLANCLTWLQADRPNHHGTLAALLELARAAVNADIWADIWAGCWHHCHLSTLSATACISAAASGSRHFRWILQK
ncbi:hypothetical protein ACVILI_000096 [Mesorhizobium sp. USDA 4775]